MSLLHAVGGTNEDRLKLFQQAVAILEASSLDPDAKRALIHDGFGAGPYRFGTLEITDSQVQAFTEKPLGDGNLINGGFFVLSPQVLDLIEGDDSIWEDKPVHALVRQQQLAAYQHTGFWRPMDTLRDKTYLEELWASGAAPWKKW